MLDTFEFRIEELEDIKAVISARIKELKDKAGYCEDFDQTLKNVSNEIKRLIAERVEVDDDEALWDIFFMLQSCISTVVDALKNGCTELDD